MIIVGPYPKSIKIVGGTAYAVKSLVDVSRNVGLKCCVVNTSFSGYSRAPFPSLFVSVLRRMFSLLCYLWRESTAPVLIFVSSGSGVLEKLLYSYISKVLFRRSVFVFIRSGNFCSIHSSGFMHFAAISLFNYSDRVLIQSRHYFELFVSTFSLKRISIIVFPNWLPYTLSNESCVYPLDLESGCVRFVVCGNLLAYKSHDQSLRLFQSLSSALSELQISSELLVLGDGPEYSNLNTLAFDLGISDSVSFLGHLDHDDVGSIFQTSWFYISMSPFEGFSNSLLQAMSCGVIPIVRMVGGVPELIVDTDIGFIAECQNVDSFDVQPVLALVQNPKAFKSLRSSLIRLMSNKFSPNRATDLYHMIYNFPSS